MTKIRWAQIFTAHLITHLHITCDIHPILLRKFAYHLTLKQPKPVLINLPRHPRTPVQDASCVIPNECDILNSLLTWVGNKYSCNIILSRINQVILETLFQIPITSYLLAKRENIHIYNSGQYGYRKRILLKSINSRRMIKPVDMFY